MPIYEYQCRACGKQMEFIQRASEALKSDCPQCGETDSLKKLISSPAIQFKGSGWYLTDYSDKGKKNRASEKKESEASSSEASSTESAKTKESTGKQNSASASGK